MSAKKCVFFLQARGKNITFHKALPLNLVLNTCNMFQEIPDRFDIICLFKAVMHYVRKSSKIGDDFVPCLSPIL